MKREFMSVRLVEPHGSCRWSAWLLILICSLSIIPAASAAAEDLSLSPGVTLVIGEGWSSIRPRAGEAAVLQLRGTDMRTAGRALVTIQSGRSVDDAISGLVQWVRASGATPTVSEVSGWPAVTFTQAIAPDQSEDSVDALPADPFTRIVTLVAIESRLVRISVTISTKPGPEVLLRARLLAGGLRISGPADAKKARRWLASVRAALRAKSPLVRPLAMAHGGRRGTLPLTRMSETIEPSTATAAGPGSELEIAVSPNGQDIVIGMLKRTVTSNDGGATFGPSVEIPKAPVEGGTFGRLSDPSVARAPSGRFYLSYLGKETFPDDTSRQTVSVAVSEPPQRGNNFSFLSHVARCADEDVFTTDQPHMTVDPRARAGHADQIYVAWRRSPPKDDTATCSGGTWGFHTMLTCSPDGGATWPTTTFIDEFGMYPRVAAGHDGMVYVVSETSRENGTIWLTKLSSCEDGLKIQGLSMTVAEFTGVPCRIPGLDRCNGGNIQASPTVAVDPARPSHVFVAYADRTAEGNEDVVVRGSLNGGETWPLQTTANSSRVVARRYMPWLCAAPGKLFVSWYDRRLATPDANDLTQYFVNVVRPIDDLGHNQPNRLSRAVEASVGAIPDPQCRLWPTAPRNREDAERCSRALGPQPAGRCCVLDANGKCTEGSSRKPCDFSDTPGVGTPPCLAGETCATGGGAPKYGDYTGNACIAGRAFLTWASATNPEDGTPLPSSGVFFATADAVTHTTVADLCSDNRCGNIDLGNVRELLLRCPSTGANCRIVASVPEICRRMVDCPGCRPDGLCPQEFTFEVDGLNAGWALRIVDEEGRAVHGSVPRTGSTLAVAMRPGKAQAINGRVGRYFLVLERNGPGTRTIPMRIRVIASATGETVRPQPGPETGAQPYTQWSVWRQRP